MSNTYNKSYASLQTIKHDTTVLDAQRIFIKTPQDSISSRTDIISYIDGKDTGLSDRINALNERATTLSNNLSTITNKAITVDNNNWQIVNQQVALGILEPKYFTTNLENRTNATHGVGIRIDKTHFIPGGSTINKIVLPYGEGGNSGFSNDHWCHIYPYDINNQLIGNAIISTTSCTRPADNEGESSWDFAGNYSSVLPENYEYIVIKISGTNIQHPNANGTGIRVLVANIGGTSNHSSFADRCYVLGDNKNYPGGNFLAVVNVDYHEPGDTLLERIEKIENTVAPDENMYADKVTTETAISEIKDSINVVGSEEQFSNLSGNTNETRGFSIQLSKAHFITPGNIINRLHLPYQLNDLVMNNQYSHIQFFNEDGLLVKQYNSEDTQSRAKNTNGVSSWLYDNAEVPNYSYVRFTVSDSKTVTPNGQTGASCSPFRINVVNIDGVEFDDDECKVWNESGESNYMGEVKVDYSTPGTVKGKIAELEEQVDSLEENNASLLNTITNLLSHIEQLEQRITELEERGTSRLRRS